MENIYKGLYPHTSSIKNEAFDIYQKAARKLIFDDNAKIIFIHGGPGTGKSYLIQELQKDKSFLNRALIVAPTGIAANNINGKTIHSLFRLKSSNIYTKKTTKDLAELNIAPQRNAYKQTLSKTAFSTSKDILVIDEISMVRADLFDRINDLLKIATGNSLPFGDIKIVMIGDMYQLPPVVVSRQEVKTKTDEFFIERYGYENAFFFNSRVFQDLLIFHKLETNKNLKINYLELKTQHRQDNDQSFLTNLNKVRVGDCTNLDFFSNIIDRNKADIIPVLTPWAETAREKNKAKLKELKDRGKRIEKIPAKQTIKLKNKEIKNSTIEDPNFYERLYKDSPAEEELFIAEGARVMFIQNDPQERYFNGTLGTVKEIQDEIIKVLIDDKKHIINVSRHTWTQDISERDEITRQQHKEAIFQQFPLRLAYAMTIHKAQGTTLNKIFIDFYDANKKRISTAFDFGQTYVALSRVKNHKDLFIGKKLTKTDIDPKYIERKQVDTFINNLKDLSNPFFALLFSLALARVLTI